MKIDIAIECFLNYQETFNEETTVKHYRDNIKHFVTYLEIFEKYDFDINDMTISLYNQYVAYLRKKKVVYNFGKVSDKPLSKRTILTYTRALKTMFKWLYDEEYIEKDVASKMKLIKPNKTVEVPLYADQVQAIDDLFNLKSHTGLRNWCVIHLMLDCGLRVSEVIDLEIDHIDFKHKTIKIVDGKGGKDRYLPLPSNLKRHLYDFIYIYRLHCNHNYALQTKDGSQLKYQGLKSLMARIKKRTGIDNLKCHLLRHTFATCYILGGGDIASLRIYMGHSSITTTDGYLHLANTYKLLGNDNYYSLDRIYYKVYERKII